MTLGYGFTSSGFFLFVFKIQIQNPNVQPPTAQTILPSQTLTLLYFTLSFIETIL